MAGEKKPLTCFVSVPFPKYLLQGTRRGDRLGLPGADRWWPLGHRWHHVCRLQSYQKVSHQKRVGEGIARSRLHENSEYDFIRNTSPKNKFMVLQNRSLICCCIGVAEWLRTVGWLLSWWPWRGGRRSTARSRPWFRWKMFISLQLWVMGYRVLPNTLFFYFTWMYCVKALFRIFFRITLMIQIVHFPWFSRFFQMCLFEILRFS